MDVHLCSKAESDEYRPWRNCHIDGLLPGEMFQSLGDTACVICVSDTSTDILSDELKVSA